MSSNKRFNNKKEYLQYVREYKEIKNFLDNEIPNEGINYITKIQEKIGNSITEFDKLVINVLLCILQNKANKITENLALIEKIDGTIKDPLMLIDFTLAKAETLLKIGKQQEVLSSLNFLDDIVESYKIESQDSQNTSFLDREGAFQNLKGITYWFLGDVQGALKAFQEALNLRELLGNEKYFATSLNNLGSIYTYQGELHVALELYMQALKILKELPNKIDLATTYSNIGELYHYLDNYELAVDFYKQSEAIFESIESPLALARCYYQILILQIEYKNIHEAENYFDKIKPLDFPVGENSYIHTLFLISEGLILKNSSSLMKKFKAAENFLLIANSPIVDSELSVQAIFHLNDILLLEIRLSQNEDNLAEIKKWSAKIISLAESQQSPVLMIQSYLLDSKLKLLEYHIRDSEDILLKAKDLANQKGLMKFIDVITRELEQLRLQEEQWINLREKGAPLLERINLTGLESTLNNLIRKRLDSHELIDLIVKSINPSVKNLKSAEKIDQTVIENFYSILTKETYITIFRQFKLGPEIFISDELIFSKLNKTVLETKMGVYLMTAIGQGSNSNEGLFGPLPIPDNSEYVSLVYSCFMGDSENDDPRMAGKSYCLIVVTFPKQFEPYYTNRRLLSKVFENFINKFDKIQDITLANLNDLKLDLVK